jgi:hypothetical protein
LAGKLEADIKAEEAYWNKTLKELPDQKKLKAYEKKLKGLNTKKSDLGSLLGKAGDALSVQKEIQADLKLIKAAQKRFEKSSKALQKRVKALPKAPLADIRRLTAKYSLSADGLANLSQLLSVASSATIGKPPGSGTSASSPISPTSPQGETGSRRHQNRSAARVAMSASPRKIPCRPSSSGRPRPRSNCPWAT